MRKKYAKGCVAVLISPGYGAGWSTWNRDQSGGLLFDENLVNLVIARDNGVITESEFITQITEYCNAEYPNAYLGGASDLVVKWLEIGTEFIVVEYDGNESLQFKDDIQWMTA